LYIMYELGVLAARVVIWKKKKQEPVEDQDDWET
jgi:hypothetical protein